MANQTSFLGATTGAVSGGVDTNPSRVSRLQASRRATFVSGFLVLAAVLVAFSLRIAHLGYQCLRGDEAFSVMVSRWNLGNLFNLLATTEPHPPLYYTFLHYWMSIAGDSEFSLRFPSVFFGVLLVPVTFSMGRCLEKPPGWIQTGSPGKRIDAEVKRSWKKGVAPATPTLISGVDRGSREFAGRPLGRPVALHTESANGSRRLCLSASMLAMWIVAVNPLLLWHSQDVRSYSMLAFFSSASVLLSTRGLSTWRERCAYVLVTYAAMLTHYSAFYVVLAENLAALVLIALYAKKEVAATVFRWLAGQLTLAVAYLPWVLWAIKPITTHAADWMHPIGLAEFLERTLVAVGAGTTVEPESRLLVLVAMSLVLCFAAGGIVLARSSRERLPIAVGGFYFVAPALILFAFASQRPMFDERHLVILVTAFAILASFGIVMLTRRLWLSLPISIILIGSLAVLSLGNYFFNPAFNKSANWRSLTAEIRRQEQSGDYILINLPDPTFAYYYRGPIPVGLLPLRVPVDRLETEQELTKLVSTYHRIWLVPSPSASYDADGLVEKWLTDHTHKVGEASFGGARLALYSVDG